jgi:hypothetical protein
MKKLLTVILLALASFSAIADSYQVTFGWTDSTTYIASDVPQYEARYRINGGTAVALPATATPSGTVSVVAAPGSPIDVSVRNVNKTLTSAWSGWVTATAPFAATQPGDPAGLTVTISRSGP